MKLPYSVELFERELLSHSQMTSIFILVVVEKFIKKGAKFDKLFILFSFILNKNFKVLNSFEFKQVSVLWISLAINLKNNFMFILIKFMIVCCSAPWPLMLLSKDLLFLGELERGELYWALLKPSALLLYLILNVN